MTWRHLRSVRGIIALLNIAIRRRVLKASWCVAQAAGQGSRMRRADRRAV